MELTLDRYHVSAQFEAFLMERISGPEFDFFQKRIGPLSIYPAGNGTFYEDFQAVGSKRMVRFSYYYSDSLRRLFVLGAHLVRLGEPTDFDQELMDAYRAAISRWEKHPDVPPEGFEGGQG